MHSCLICIWTRSSLLWQTRRLWYPNMPAFPLNSFVFGIRNYLFTSCRLARWHFDGRPADRLIHWSKSIRNREVLDFQPCILAIRRPFPHSDRLHLDLRLFVRLAGQMDLEQHAFFVDQTVSLALLASALAFFNPIDLISSLAGSNTLRIVGTYLCLVSILLLSVCLTDLRLM